HLRFGRRDQRRSSTPDAGSVNSGARWRRRGPDHSVESLSIGWRRAPATAGRRLGRRGGAGIEPRGGRLPLAPAPVVAAGLFFLTTGLAPARAEPIASREFFSSVSSRRRLGPAGFDDTPAPQQASGAGVLVVLGIN